MRRLGGWQPPYQSQQAVQQQATQPQRQQPPQTAPSSFAAPYMGGWGGSSGMGGWGGMGTNKPPAPPMNQPGKQFPAGGMQISPTMVGSDGGRTGGPPTPSQQAPGQQNPPWQPPSQGGIQVGPTRPPPPPGGYPPPQIIDPGFSPPSMYPPSPPSAPKPGGMEVGQQFPGNYQPMPMPNPGPGGAVPFPQAPQGGAARDRTAALQQLQGDPQFLQAALQAKAAGIRPEEAAARWGWGGLSGTRGFSGNSTQGSPPGSPQGSFNGSSPNSSGRAGYPGWSGVGGWGAPGSNSWQGAVAGASGGQGPSGQPGVSPGATAPPGQQGGAPVGGGVSETTNANLTNLGITPAGQENRFDPQVLGLPNSPQFIAAEQSLLDDLNRTLLEIGIQRDQIPAYVEQFKSRMTTDAGLENLSINQNAADRGLENSSIRTRGLWEASIPRTRAWRDYLGGVQDTQGQLSGMEMDAQERYRRGMQEALMREAQNQYANPSSAMYSGNIDYYDPGGGDQPYYWWDQPGGQIPYGDFNQPERPDWYDPRGWM